MAKSAEKKISSIFAKPLHDLTIRLMYVLLLIAFLVIGYLLGQLNSTGGNFIAGDTQSGNSAEREAAPLGELGDSVFADVDSGHLPPKGDENAPVTMIEFSDFECPFCASFYSQSLPQIITEYIDTGKVKLYYRHLTLDFHDQAKPAALASECANEQGSFWDYHDKIFDNQSQLSGATTDTYVTWASELGLNEGQFRTCLESEKYAENVDRDNAAAAAAGASGTPTFYINGQQLVGAQPFASFKAIIDQELGQ